MKNGVKTYITLFMGVAALSTSAIFVRLAGAPSSVTAFYRLLFTTLALLPVLIFDRGARAELFSLSRRQVLLTILSGLLLAVHYIMWFESLRFTSISSSTVLVSLQPLFSLAFGLFFLGEKPKKSSVAGCIVALAGSAMIAWGDFTLSRAALTGDILALLAAGVISLYFLIGQTVRRDTGVVPYSVFSYFSSSVFLLLYALIMRDPLSGYAASTWGAFLGIALISTIGGQFVFNLLLKRLPASSVTMSILGEPVGTCILAYFIFAERIAPRQFIGIIFIMLGLSIFFIYPMLQTND